MKYDIIYNPYSGVDWNTTPRIKSVSHEHVFSAETLARAYDRGIRFFATVHYIPACPRYPYSEFTDGTGVAGEVYEDWNYYDILAEMGNAVAARKAVPSVISDVTTNYYQQGFICGYLENGVHKLTKLVRNLMPNETWEECCEDETAWIEVALEDRSANLTRKNKVLNGGFPTFSSKSSASDYNGGIASISFDGDGETHNSDDFPRIPNCEHTLFKDMQHFNVLGTLTPEASWSVGIASSIRSQEEMQYYDEDSVGVLFTSKSSFYDGKLFGTWNHNTMMARFQQIQDKYPWFKGYEIYNNGMDSVENNKYPECFHQILNEGRTIFCLASCDWQGDYGGISDVDGGTNVLYMPSNYDSLTLENKSKAGMDCFCSGRFVASRFGTRNITDFSINEETGIATLAVSETAHTLSLVFNGNRVSLNNVSEISLPIPRGTKNITGEAFFGDGSGNVWKSESKLADEADFIYTQAIIVRQKSDDYMNTIMKDFILSD